jgi:hypothetical protein
MIIALLQNCVDIQKDIRGFRSETRSVSRDENHVISIKVEETIFPVFCALGEHVHDYRSFTELCGYTEGHTRLS